MSIATTTLKTVFRVEHETHGIGPYTGEFEYSDEIEQMRGEHINRYTHPNKWDDFFNTDIIHNKDYIFGFDTQEKLLTWFEDYFLTLVEAGFRIVTYSVAEYFLGDSKKQCIFIPTQETKVDITTNFLIEHKISY